MVSLSVFYTYTNVEVVWLWSNTPFRENPKDRDVSRPYIIFGIGAQKPKNEDRCIQFQVTRILLDTTA